MINDTLGDRMKRYESSTEPTLPERLPIILRLDGRAFHTLTRRLDRPFDEGFHGAMVAIAAKLGGEIQGARFAYTQSDEISILIYPRTTMEQPWFGNRVQKMVSVSASLAASLFSYTLQDRIGNLIPSFDARVFVIPTFDVPNYFIWRYMDATRNSVSAHARTQFSHKDLQGKRVPQMLEMLEGTSEPWENLVHWKKFGSLVLRLPISDNLAMLKERVVRRNAECGNEAAQEVMNKLKNDSEHLRFAWQEAPVPDWLAEKGWFDQYLTQPTYPA